MVRMISCCNSFPVAVILHHLKSLREGQIYKNDLCSIIIVGNYASNQCYTEKSFLLWIKYLQAKLHFHLYSLFCSH